MAKKTKNEFDGLTVDELKARRDECQRSIDELLGKRQKLDDKIHIDILNGNLKRIMNKWVKVKNYTWIDESNEEVYGYRVFKVVGVESWVQDNRFKIAIENGFSSASLKTGPYRTKCKKSLSSAIKRIMKPAILLNGKS